MFVPLLILCLSLHTFLPASEVGGPGDVKKGMAAGEEKKKREFIADPNDPINKRFVELLKEFVKVTYYYKTGEAPVPLSEFQKEKEPLFKELLQLLDKGANPNVFDVKLIDKELVWELNHIIKYLKNKKTTLYPQYDKLDHTFRRSGWVKPGKEKIPVSLNEPVQQYMMQKVQELIMRLLNRGADVSKMLGFLEIFLSMQSSNDIIQLLLDHGVKIGPSDYKWAIDNQRRDIIQLFLKNPQLFAVDLKRTIDYAMDTIASNLTSGFWTQEHAGIFMDLLAFAVKNNVAFDVVQPINTYQHDFNQEAVRFMVNQLLLHGFNYKTVDVEKILSPAVRKIVEEEVTKKAIAESPYGASPGVASMLERFMFGGEEPRETVGEVRPEAGDAKSAAAGKS